MSKAFYTIIQAYNDAMRLCFYVRYVLPPNMAVQEFPYSYNDPGEAGQEFKKYEQFQNAEYLSKARFERRAREYEQDALKLQQWNACMKV